MKLKKSVKTWKNEKPQHPNGCYKSIKRLKSNSQNFEFFLACFKRKMAKNVGFFRNFLKDSDFFFGGESTSSSSSL